MLAPSPSAAAGEALATLEPVDAPRPGRFRRGKGRRFGIGAWLSIVWLGIVVV